MKYWYEMLDAEREVLEKKLLEIKPRTVLEIGAGTGRIINILLKNSNAKIVSTEENREVFERVKKRFQKNKRVEIIFSEGTLPTNKKFDLVVCMMNTLGNQVNENKIIEYVLSISDKMIFTVYKKGSEQIRKEIYKLRDHEDFTLTDSCFYFNDYWCKGLISKTYSKKDIEETCNKFDCRIKISELSKIAYVVEVNRR